MIEYLHYILVLFLQHTAPQHRQYLSYDGIGFGTPFQRQKQYRQIRAIQAADNVMQHRITKITAEEKALWDKSATKYKHKIKTRQESFDLHYYYFFLIYSHAGMV